MRGKDAQYLDGEPLVVEREIYTDWEIPEMGYKRPFYYNVLERKLLRFTCKKARKDSIAVIDNYLDMGWKALTNE